MFKKIAKMGVGICAFALAAVLLVKGEAKADITVGEPLQVGPNVTASLDNTGVLTISGTGNMWDDTEDTSMYYNKWFNNKKSDIYKIVINKGVTSIGRRAFCYLENVQSVSIPNSVTAIEAYAFQKTVALREVKIPASVSKIGFQSFYDSGIVSCTLSRGIKEIEDFAFAHCANLMKVSIPAGVEAVGAGAFVESGLTKVKIGDNVGIIKKDAFPAVEANIISSKVTIGENAFPAGSVLTVYKGSSAEEYAKLNNLTIKYHKDSKGKSLSVAKVTGLKLTALYKGFTVKFTGVRGASGYEILYASNSAMLEPSRVLTKSNSYVLKGLESGKVYYIKVRAYKTSKGKRVFGKYSKEVKGKTK